MTAHKRKKIIPATPEELKLIEELTQRSVVERLESGESEIVSQDDWSDIPELPVDEEARFLPNTTQRNLNRADNRPNRR